MLKPWNIKFIDNVFWYKYHQAIKLVTYILKRFNEGEWDTPLLDRNIINAYVLVETSQGRRHLGERRWQNNIKMFIREIMWYRELLLILSGSIQWQVMYLYANNLS